MARSGHAGFSLAEVLLAMGTFTLVILTMIALIISLNRGSRKSIDLAAAQFAADQVITILVDRAQKNQPPGEHSRFWDNDYSAPGAAYQEGSLTANRTEFFYRMDATTARDATNNPINDDLPFNRVKLVQVEIYWWNPSSTATRAGYGRLTTRASRLVHEKRI